MISDGVFNASLNNHSPVLRIGGKKLSKPIAFRGITLYLFISGLAALFLAPFLTWFDYGLNFLLPSQVSLIYLFLFDRGFRVDMVLYLAGVAAAVVAAEVGRRPVFFQGILPAVFPLWTFVVFTLQPYYPHVFTLGIFMAFFGSVLLETSYFSYRKKAKHQSKSALAENTQRLR